MGSLGIAFDLTIVETLRLFTFLDAYHHTLLALKDDHEPETQKLIRVVIDDAQESKLDLPSA